MASKSSIASRKTVEGDELMKQADKMTAKSLFKWKPDYEGACTVYEKAGTCYKNAKEFTLAKEAYKKASNAYYHMDITFSAAKHMENAGDMAKQAGEDDEAVELFQKASVHYRENSTPEKSAEVLVKAAKILEEKESIDKAIELANDACVIFETDDKEQFATATYAYAAGLFIRAKRWEEVIEQLKRQKRAHEKLNQTHDVNKMVLSLVIVHLARDDYVAADREYQEAVSNLGSFLGTTEASATAELLDAYEKRNNDQLKAVTNKQVFGFLSQPVARLAKSLKTSGDAIVSSSGKETIEEEGLA